MAASQLTQHQVAQPSCPAVAVDVATSRLGYRLKQPFWESWVACALAFYAMVVGRLRTGGTIIIEPVDNTD